MKDDSCYCSDALSGGYPCQSGRCPNIPSIEPVLHIVGKVIPMISRDILYRVLPPIYCPSCNHLVQKPVKDKYGLWTWACLEGCNP
jgi:hypothetical protein